MHLRYKQPEEEPVITKETATRVLSAALRSGGDLAEIYGAPTIRVEGVTIGGKAGGGR
jgi:hypothetical protein